MEERRRECGQPCHPEDPCPKCEEYWDRMRREGLWIDGQGWTDKAVKDWCRLSDVPGWHW
ncbi:MAG: hypothetical protein ACOC5T_02720 [Elusimicrobiota bacterium]